jgi:hypothetical protein
MKYATRSPEELKAPETGRHSADCSPARSSVAAWRISKYIRRESIPHAAWQVIQGDVRIIGNLSRSEAERILKAHESCLPPNDELCHAASLANKQPKGK